MNRICEIPKITKNLEVLFHEEENPAGAKAYQKQEEAVKKAWRRILSRKFDSIEVFALDNLPFGERRDVRILTHSLRNPEKIQLTVISNQDGFPSYHIEYRLSRLISELAVFSAHHPYVYAEILSYPDQEDYRKAFDLCRKYNEKGVHYRKK